ncbi:DUF2452 domain-containing protein [Salinisphaera sp. LB1]|uniref:DUF2452 domain-containing protein n=1 Tax=Salinisphaera sp. LB1 TaxID=2183911 RepID=UPI000D706FFB|nr:DUF2452 domain-containing protein [Salinisphaera sp. LB1]AWN14911.1 hypothetical protein SALB1_0704 [Salinisphaera sp. LB1]
MKNPNPDGKGVSPVLATLDEARGGLAVAAPKHIDQVATELFTSLFVLESEFRFKPVVGKTYYLYRQPERFWLGITPPEMLGETVAGRFIGTCVLQSDMTWTLELAEAVAADAHFMAWLAARRAAFERRLGEAETVDDILPVYESRLSFYRRASAFGVAHSLSRSMSASGISGLSYDEARGLLTDAGARDHD